MNNLKRKISKLMVAIMVVLSLNVSGYSGFAINGNEKVYAAAAKTKKGIYEGFVDRLNFPNYALELYDSLYDNSLDAGGYLIDEKNVDRVEEGCYVHDVTTETGVVPASANYAIESFIQNQVGKSDVPSNIYQVYFAFYFDHPEVFWIKQSPKLRYSYSVKLNKTTGNLEYTIIYSIVIKDTYANFDLRDTQKYKTPADIIKAMAKRDSLVKKISKKVARKDSYSTVCALNKYLVKINNYNSLVLANVPGETLYTHQAMCALEGNKGKNGPICMAYAAAFKLICDNLGISCINVCGDATTANGTTGGHQWNNVKLDDGKWYAIDVTWNDTGHKVDAYLCVGSETKTAEVAFRKSHKMTNKGYTIYTGFTNQPELSKGKYSQNACKIVLAKKVYKYTGKKIKAAFKVYDKKKKLIKRKFYKVKYKNNKKCGRGEITIKFKGKYKNLKTKKVYFDIVPRTGSIDSIMPFKNSAYVKLKSVKGVSGYEIKCSSDLSFKRASSKTVTVKKNATDTLVEGLESGKTYHFRVRTYVKKNGKRYYSDYSNVSGVVIN